MKFGGKIKGIQKEVFGNFLENFQLALVNITLNLWKLQGNCKGNIRKISKKFIGKFSRIKKTGVCTGTCGRSETSLNAVAHDSIRMHINKYEKIILKFLKFFQKLRSASIFINYTNLSKLVKIIFDANLNFIKVSNISKIF